MNQDRYWLNTKTGQMFDTQKESLNSIRKRTRNSRKILKPIFGSAYKERKKDNPKDSLLVGRDFFQDRARRYHVSENELIIIWSLQFGECALCGDELNYNGDTHVDHIIPKKQGGEDKIDNLQFVCAKCNYAKRDLSTRDFLILCLKIGKKNQYKIPKIEVMQVLSHIWRREDKEERKKYKQDYLKALQNQSLGNA